MLLVPFRVYCLLYYFCNVVFPRFYVASILLFSIFSFVTKLKEQKTIGHKKRSFGCYINAIKLAINRVSFAQVRRSETFPQKWFSRLREILTRQVSDFQASTMLSDFVLARNIRRVFPVRFRCACLFLFYEGALQDMLTIFIPFHSN